MRPFKNKTFGGILMLLCTVCIANAQTDRSSLYRSPDNPQYWKNRKPHEAYWQQDVYYNIKAKIDDKTDIVEGYEELTYWNNSPNELRFVYFHLYNNAQVKNSYLSDLYTNNKNKVWYGKYQEQGLGTHIEKITSGGADLKTELDNTVIKVFLTEPLKPNQSVQITIDFKTYYDTGGIRNRMKFFNAYGYKHYDLVHWYPRISVYDQKFGWDTQQHLDHEFYGDYGNFDVELTFPNNYILDATGVLQNKEEVMPPELREKLDIKNFITKPWNEKPSEVILPDGTTKTWKFYAENVHDFAATADPTYRIGETEYLPSGKNPGEGIKCVALVQEPHASRWQNAAAYTAKVLKTYSEDFGMYIYPKMIVADARDGMEYPMLTLDGGQDPEYRGLLAHEIGHNWFFGMVGNNETYRAALDEGFTQFLTSWSLERIDGKYIVQNPPKSPYVEKHLRPSISRNSRVYNPYINDAVKFSSATINTHSDEFENGIAHGGGYRQVYYKTATMLYNLQYVLGDSLFLASMQHYFNQWKVCHPYLEDFRSSIINFSHVDLNWFFDQWMETAKTIDYKFVEIEKESQPNEYSIELKRIGSMQMPIDFSVYTDTAEYKFHIPNNWFVKKTDATVLPRWIGWGKVKPDYETKIIVPGKITNVVIDPSERLADVNMLNNSKKFPVRMEFDSKIYNTSDWTAYEIFYRPELWYNGYDGLKLGWHVNGNYLNNNHLFDATLWLNTGLAQSNIPKEAYFNKYDNLNFRINYRTATDKFMKGSSLYLSAKALDGLNAYILGFDRQDVSGKNKVYMFFKSMYRMNEHTLNYLLLPGEWGIENYNNTINIGIEHTYSYEFGEGTINLNTRSSALESSYDYTLVSLTAINKNILANKVSFNTRTFIQYGTGSNWASESSLFLAGANPEELMDNKYTRSQGFFAPSMASIGTIPNNFQYGGGLNLRGYASYLAPEVDKHGNLVMSYKGSSGAAINAELEFSDLINFKPKLFRNWLNLATYLFGDVGVINVNNPTETLWLGNVRADAGVGAALTIKKFGPLQTVKPLTIRFDLPLFLNRIPATTTDYFAFRWLLSVSRAF